MIYVSEKTIYQGNVNANWFLSKLLQEIHLFKTNKSAKLLEKSLKQPLTYLFIHYCISRAQKTMGVETTSNIAEIKWSG